jgi:hypothetical protein
VRLLADISDMSVTATSQMFVAGPRNVRTHRPARTVVGFVLMSLALTFGIQRVVMAAPLGGSGHAALRIQGVGGDGMVSSSAPIIDVAGAYPGMAAQTSTFQIRNSGTIPVAFLVSSTDLVANGPRSLDDVLRITVRDPSTGHLVYQGRLSGLRIKHTGVLAPGTAARFTVEVTWPSIPADAAYQGAGLHFSVVASPAAA